MRHPSGPTYAPHPGKCAHGGGGGHEVVVASVDVVKNVVVSEKHAHNTYIMHTTLRERNIIIHKQQFENHVTMGNNYERDACSTKD